MLSQVFISDQSLELQPRQVFLLFLDGSPNSLFRSFWTENRPKTVDLFLRTPVLVQFFTKNCGKVRGLDFGENPLQGYLAHKKHPPPQDHHRSLGIGLL